MGIPTLFRWLAAKYPKIVLPVIEDDGSTFTNRDALTFNKDNPVENDKPNDDSPLTDGIDLMSPNPNGIEYDNLYLDMNGIIHPCCHPEGKPAPSTEKEMFQAIFEYTDHIFSMIRPRRLLYLAVDGVAPRAKMNQQRARRFRAAQEAEEKAKKKLEEEEEEESDSGEKESIDVIAVESNVFDTNCITPGTPFMATLSKALRWYVQDRISKELAWQKIKVIISDSNVPGEGEHKIVDYIRRQRVAGLEASKEQVLNTGQSLSYDPNQFHVIYGLDADLIMLSLATHEPRFNVLREDVFAQEVQQRDKCRRCQRSGHVAANCTSTTPVEQVSEKKSYIFLSVATLREYLNIELQPTDLERAIDDWIFLCFFVGNDFLPHLPSLDIREGAIDILIDIYKRVNLSGYICNGGHVDMSKAEIIMRELARIEPDIFKKRQDKEERRRANENRRRAQEAGSGPTPNKKAASLLKSTHESSANIGEKRTRSSINDSPTPSSESEMPPHDEIRFHEAGFQERYYRMKFEVDHHSSLVSQVVSSYVEGLAWVMAYYYQGCPSWSWFFPFHYAPFASDFVDIDKVKVKFELGTPFRPFDQLMSVFPAASRTHIPEPFHHLMIDANSELIDFYPTSFPIDMNGKRHAWQGVVLLPFIDQDRLITALNKIYPQVSEEDMERNALGMDNLYAHESLYVDDIFGNSCIDMDRNSHNARIESIYGSIKRCSAVTYIYRVPYHNQYDLNYLNDLFPGTIALPSLLSEEEINAVSKGEVSKRFQNIMGYKTREELAEERAGTTRTNVDTYRPSSTGGSYREDDRQRSDHRSSGREDFYRSSYSSNTYYSGNYYPQVSYPPQYYYQPPYYPQSYQGYSRGEDGSMHEPRYDDSGRVIYPPASYTPSAPFQSTQYSGQYPNYATDYHATNQPEDDSNIQSSSKDKEKKSTTKSFSTGRWGGATSDKTGDGPKRYY